MRFDFLPIIRRTIQDDGISIDDIQYFDDVLRPWVGKKNPNHPTEAMTYPFRRDPREISSILFWDANLLQIFEIRSRLGPMSIWEWKHAKTATAASGRSPKDESAVYQNVQQTREIEAAAAHKTKTARREEERRKQNAKNAKSKIKAANRGKPKPADAIPGYNPDEIVPIPEE